MISENAYDYNGCEVSSISSRDVEGFAVLFDATGTCVRVAVAYDRATATMSVNPALSVDVAAIEWMHEHGATEVRADLEELLAIHRDWLRDRDVMLSTPKMYDCRRLLGLIKKEQS